MSQAELETVFELCQPRKSDRKISLRRFQSMLEEHVNSGMRTEASVLSIEHTAFYKRVMDRKERERDFYRHL